MANKRVYELAKELNVDSKAVIAEAGKKGIDVKNHMSTLDDSQAKTLAGALGKGGKAASKKPSTAKSAPKKPAEAKAADDTKETAKKPAHKFHHNYISRNRKASANPQKIQKAEEEARRAAQAKRQAEAKKQADAEKKAAAEKQAADKKQADLKRQDGKPAAVKPAAHHSDAKTSQSRNSSERSRSNTSRPAGNNNNQHTSSAKNNHRPAATHPSSSKPVAAKPAHAKTSANKFGGNSNGPAKRNKRKKGRNRGRNENRYNMYSKNQRIRQQQKKRPTVRKNRPLPPVLEFEDGMNAQDLGKLLHREPAEIVKKLFMLGVMVNQNQSLDKEAIELLAADYNIEAKEKEHENVSDIDKTFEEEMHNTTVQESRPPVVTIMGHVDHGKTTLLDHLRNSHITSGEAGGITQAIGAYQLDHDGQKITFLDTPGHAAFTEMRARGANITDITVLVVAADDGVMPQTIEAIDHAKAAQTPIIVAVNKIDKAGANPQHVKDQLMEYGLVPEDYGGDTIFVDISAKTGKNVDDLLNMILLQSDVLELKANPDQNGAGSVVEARLDKGKGPVATLLVQQGTLHVGDPIVVGDTFGRVRTMTNENGQEIESATPSTPVEITGLNDVPEAGDRFLTFKDEKTARAAGEQRAKEAQIEERKQTNRVTLDNLFDSMKQEDLKQVNVIIKADVQGSVEALAGSLRKIDVQGVKVNVIHSSVGAINESDVALAEASNAIIIGFNVRPTPQAKSQAETDKVDIRLYQVIYNAIDDVQDAMTGMLDPEFEEEVTGSVEVRDIFKASKVGTIAGGMVQSGVIDADSKVRLIRDGVVKYDGELGSLKRFKDDVKEVKQGFECGLTIENFNDIKVGDVVEAYHMKEIPRKALKSNGKDAAKVSDSNKE